VTGDSAEYVVARRVLLDALDAIGEHRKAVVLVGAQAIYLRVPDAGIPVTPYTTDADIGLRPAFLSAEPELSSCMERAGFVLDPDEPVGIWVTEREIDGRKISVKVDLLVPEAAGGGGRRGARLAQHRKNTARKVRGLEGALFDCDPMAVGALEEDDRTHEIMVAGPAALLVAKAHKIRDRLEDKQGRVIDKDALDIVRILRGSDGADLATRLKRLQAEPSAAAVSREALDFIKTAFGVPAGRGCDMAARAATGAIADEELRASTVDLVQRLLRGVTPPA
jgi:hypothetical protein